MRQGDYRVLLPPLPAARKRSPGLWRLRLPDLPQMRLPSGTSRRTGNRLALAPPVTTNLLGRHRMNRRLWPLMNADERGFSSTREFVFHPRSSVFIRGQFSLAILFVFLITLTACSSGPPQQPSSGVAYVGPITLNLRKDLASKSP